MHAFFVDWLSGKVVKSTEILEQHCTCHFSDDFCRVTPHGGFLMSKPQLVLGLMNAHGAYPKDFEIHIHNVQILLNLTNTLKLVHYEEWQRMDGGNTTTARRTTALLQLQTQTQPPHSISNIQWKSVHETWIEGKGPNDSKSKSVSSSATAAALPVSVAATTTASAATSTTTFTDAGTISSSLISPRRHVSDQLSSFADAIPILNSSNGDSNGDGDNSDSDNGVLVGLSFRGVCIQTLQGPMANETWLEQTTEQLSELCQFDEATLVENDDHDETAGEQSHRHRRITLPEVCFSHAVVAITLSHDAADVDDTALTSRTTTLIWDCRKALEAWSRAHAHIPVGSSVESQGVSVRKTVDAELWSHKSIPNTDFHFDWTYTTPFSVDIVWDIGGDYRDDASTNTTTSTTWMELPKSGLNMALLQDTTQPILYFDDIELYEDDLHDNGVVNFRVKLRLMPTCLYVLSRCWCRVDNAELICRETRTMVEFGARTTTPPTTNPTEATSNSTIPVPRKHQHRVYRDITWRQCAWSDLADYNLPTDARAWKNEGSGGETAAWNGLINRLPLVDLPAGVPRYSMLLFEQQQKPIDDDDGGNSSVSMQLE